MRGPRLKILDINNIPRRWWWPIHKSSESLDDKEWLKQHEETSKTIRRVLFANLAFGFYCLIVLGQPDIRLVQKDATVKLPFANTDVTYEIFLFIAPLILLALTAYLHVFVGYWRTLGQRENRFSSPYIFNINFIGATIISGFLIYWVAPCVLFGFVVKTLAGSFGEIFVILACMTTGVLIFLQIRRWPKLKWKEAKPGWSIWPYRLLWLSMGIMFSIAAIQFWFSPWPIFYRSINLYKADLNNKNLFGVKLLHATLADANLKGANLEYSILSWAWMSDADLQDANLTSSIVVESHLGGANLKNAILRNVNFSGSHLGGADLTNADLEHASLEDTSLEGTIIKGTNLEDASLLGAKLGFRVDPCTMLMTAKNWEKAYRDSAWACGAPIPAKSKFWKAGGISLGRLPPWWLRTGEFWLE